MGAVGLIPRGDINTRNQAQIGEHVGMVAMRGPPALVWVVTDLRALLFAIDRFDRGIHVQYPALLHHRMQRNCQMRFQPDFRLFVKGLCILFSGYYMSTKCRGKKSLTYKMLIGSEQNA